MEHSRHHSPQPGPAGPPSAVRSTAARSTAARSASWILGAPVLAVVATFVLAIAGAGADWIRAAWLAAVLWTIAATFLQALWSGLRHGDWSAFTCEECCAVRDDEDIDWGSRTGRFAYLRIGARHEALMREDDRVPQDPGHPGSLP